MNDTLSTPIELPLPKRPARAKANASVSWHTTPHLRVQVERSPVDGAVQTVTVYRRDQPGNRGSKQCLGVVTPDDFEPERAWRWRCYEQTADGEICYMDRSYFRCEECDLPIAEAWRHCVDRIAAEFDLLEPLPPGYRLLRDKSQEIAEANHTPRWPRSFHSDLTHHDFEYLQHIAASDPDALLEGFGWVVYDTGTYLLIPEHSSKTRYYLARFPKNAQLYYWISGLRRDAVGALDDSQATINFLACGELGMRLASNEYDDAVYRLNKRRKGATHS